MRQSEIARYKKILETKLAELVQVVRDREGIAIEKRPDPIDEVQNAEARALQISNLDRDTQTIRETKGALMRIQNGTFGICLYCDEQISPKRLNAVPSTPLCLTCKESADQLAKKTPATQEAFAL